MVPDDTNSIVALVELQKTNFRKSLPRRCDEIEAAMAGLTAGASPLHLKELHRLIHNIAGAGGTFGFPVLSELARPIAYGLRARVEGPSYLMLLEGEVAQFTLKLEPLIKEMRTLATPKPL